MKQKIPFAFVIEELERLHPVIKPMFGCYAVYVGEKIVVILRDRKDHEADNGVWLAIPHEHHESLKKIFPCLRSIGLLGKKETLWQNIPVDEDDFEELVFQSVRIEIVKKEIRGSARFPNKKVKKRRFNPAVDFASGSVLLYKVLE